MLRDQAYLANGRATCAAPVSLMAVAGYYPGGGAVANAIEHIYQHKRIT